MKRAAVFFLVVLLSFPAAQASAQADLQVEVVPSATGSIPRGAQRVEMLSMTFAASCGGDISIASIMIHREGKGTHSDIDGIYAIEKGRRLTRKTSLSTRDGEATLRLSRFVVPRCGEKMITIAADFAADAQSGSEHAFAVRASSDISAGQATVTLRAAEPSVPARTVQYAEGTISVEYLSLPKPVRYGKRQTIARIRLAADHIADQEITSLTLTNDGSARNADLQNLFLVSNRSERLSMLAPSLDGDAVRFSFAPTFLLPKNAERVINVVADVRASRRRTIRLLVEEPSDISAQATRRARR